MSEPSNYHESQTGKELEDSIQKFYKNRDRIVSNKYKRSEDEIQMTAEERADFLFANGYMDEQLVSREYVIERIKKQMRKDDENTSKQD